MTQTMQPANLHESQTHKALHAAALALALVRAHAVRIEPGRWLIDFTADEVSDGVQDEFDRDLADYI